MCGIENRVRPASSCEMTHSRISSRLIDHASANVSIVAGTNTSDGVARGIGRSYTPNALRARLPTIEPTLMPSIAGAIILPSPAIIAAIGSSFGSGRRIVGRPERRGEVGEQRPVGVERLQRPLLGGRDLRLDGRHVELHHVGHVEAGDVGQLGVLDAHARVDVGRRNGGGGAGQCTAAGGRQQGELSCRVPVQRALPGQRPGEVAEHRQAGERVAGRVAAKRVDGVVRIVVVGHDVDATAIGAPVVLAGFSPGLFWPISWRGVGLSRR